MNNKTCGECKYHSEKCHCTKFCCYAGESDFCDEFEPAKKPIITKGDVIRQGGDKRLITFATEWSCFHCVYRNGIESKCEKPEGKDCFDGIEAWLKAPAESEGEDE